MTLYRPRLLAGCPATRIDMWSAKNRAPDIWCHHTAPVHNAHTTTDGLSGRVCLLPEEAPPSIACHISPPLWIVWGGFCYTLCRGHLWRLRGIVLDLPPRSGHRCARVPRDVNPPRAFVKTAVALHSLWTLSRRQPCTPLLVYVCPAPLCPRTLIPHRRHCFRNPGVTLPPSASRTRFREHERRRGAFYKEDYCILLYCELHPPLSSRAQVRGPLL